MMLSDRMCTYIARRYIGPIKGGIESRYIDINASCGIKFSRNKDRLTVIYLRQKWAYINGLGPAVGKLTSFRRKDFGGNERKYYAFVTEKLLVKDEPGFNVLWEQEAKSEWTDRILSDKHHLNFRLKELGFRSCFFRDFDLTCSNVGYKNNQIMPIDFGWGNEDERASYDEAYQAKKLDIHEIMRDNGLDENEFIKM